MTGVAQMEKANKEVAKAEITPGEKYKNLEHKLIELEQGIQKLVGGNNILRKIFMYFFD